MTVNTSPAREQRYVTLPARPEPLRLAIDETAVVVVDMQNAYASPNGYLDLAGFDISGAKAAITAIQDVLDVARGAGVPVIFFQNGWDADYVEAGGPGSPNWHKSNALKTMRKRPELQGKLLAKGGWDYALVDDLQPKPGDIVVPKTRYSGFFNSQFDSILRARGIRNLVFCGIATNVCVESTLRDAFHLEYFGVMLEDATHQAGPDYIQKASIFNIETFFGWVSSASDFRRAFAQTEAVPAKKDSL
ncbi:pyrimidine utilization protein B [Bradyrhizobium sacchari]|uniref:Ureidoacrylate amidohydrolase RutB n=1 Tax=Bradyrhizobium sacchari TaxID=1399419 RepID=A0A560J4Y1_9BRAD|nr:pyrimidine utilization protein B [Bradyrhizobium sacchari]OPY96945.1 pyrimidine utilization protein B [Bradyrhizobium sacchari]TWB47715.1 ureidoacrylate peracid hydrolase [Bradyrhizobium sacchari]TWB66191.1 ureidoacrylate peracid hydrolase [Bradyrhizobium sacchari]